MSVLGLLNQTCTIYNKISYNAQGREVVDVGTTVKCRFEAKTRSRFKPNGEVTTISAVVYVMPTVDAAIDYRVDFGSNKYKIYDVYPTVDGLGATQFLRLELMLWQKT